MSGFSGEGRRGGFGGVEGEVDLEGYFGPNPPGFANAGVRPGFTNPATGGFVVCTVK